MKGVVIKNIGAPAVVVDDLEIPVPADSQVLVKSIYTAINPVDGFMANTGLLVVEWPLILGHDAAGVIVRTGSKPVGPLGSFKVGDEVLGCSRVGMKDYSTCQEYFLMDAAITAPKPKNITLAQAATVGVGFYTACLGVFEGLHIPLPDVSSLPTPSEDWVLVTGGASSVGKYALQLLKFLGYKVATTCSTKSVNVLTSLGAELCIDYTRPPGDQVAELLSATREKITRIFDAVAVSEGLAQSIFEKVEGEEKYFTTTNDWSPMPKFQGTTISPITLGPIGRYGSDELDAQLASFIPLMVKLIEDGKVIPSEYQIIGETRIDSAIEAYAYQSAGKGGNKKVLVHIQDE